MTERDKELTGDFVEILNALQEISELVEQVSTSTVQFWIDHLWHVVEEKMSKHLGYVLEDKEDEVKFKEWLKGRLDLQKELQTLKKRTGL